jgi:hypothetical protein
MWNRVRNIFRAQASEPALDREAALAILHSVEASYLKKSEAIQYLADQCGLDREIALAILHTEHASYVRKIEAIEHLRGQGGPDIVEGLRAALGRPSVIGWERDHVRVAALEHLGHLAPDATEPFLTYDDAGVRSAAAAALHRARPDSFGAPEFTLVVFRTGEAPQDPGGTAEKLLKRKLPDSRLREWRTVGVARLASEEQTISLYHQLVREGQVPDFGPVADAWQDRGSDGQACVLLLFK